MELVSDFARCAICASDRGEPRDPDVGQGSGLVDRVSITVYIRRAWSLFRGDRDATAE